MNINQGKEQNEKCMATYTLVKMKHTNQEITVFLWGMCV